MNREMLYLNRSDIEQAGGNITRTLVSTHSANTLTMRTMILYNRLSRI